MRSNQKGFSVLKLIGGLFVGFLVLIVLVVIFGGGSGEQPKEIAETGGAVENEKIEIEEVVEKEISNTEPETEIKADRDKMIAIFKEYALTKWGSDYEMVNYEIKQQTEAYDWIIKNASYADILARAKQEWADDYTMVKYEYNQQAGAYEWINQQTTYPEIMTRAKQEWGNDYPMVKYEYENQVKAYESL